MINSRSEKIPFLAGGTGSHIRFLVGTSLKLGLDRDFKPFDRRQLSWLSGGRVEYAQQASLMREFSPSTNWDDFVNHESHAIPHFRTQPWMDL
jgi:hypothetical protein